jgi:hypothetical protein
MSDQLPPPTIAMVFEGIKRWVSYPCIATGGWGQSPELLLFVLPGH